MGTPSRSGARSTSPTRCTSWSPTGCCSHGPSAGRLSSGWPGEVALSEGVAAPELWHCYRALDHLADAKNATEVHLYNRLTGLTNLDLRLALYDLTSTFFGTDERSSNGLQPEPSVTAATEETIGPRW